ncbi:MAG TPA: acyl-CoA dehydrogenase family protein [Dermatophilaceae bacterium]|nr:acyl-CoA dehydrogenase family protein [Dermatophilaceae bacterium]
MPVTRLLPSDEARHLLDMTREVCRKQLAPMVDTYETLESERASGFPEEAFRILGAQGLLSLPYPEEYGGGGQPYEVYLQVVEEIAQVWMSVAVGTSVHALTCYPVAQYGTDAQREALLPDMLSGDWLGGYCLSEPDSGSDVASMTTAAHRLADGAGWRLDGAKAWISHAGHADYYTTFARTSPMGSRGISCFHVPATLRGLSFGAPETKMGLHGDPVAQVYFADVEIGPDLMIGAEGQGMAIALHALDNGRLGIAAAATGLAQAALDAAAAYALERRQFGKPIAEFQGLAFVLADMEAAVTSARATYLYAARLKDAGREYSKEASVAKLVATDAAMKVTTDAVQVFGGYGYTRDFPVERFMREAKVTQIFEGTNQVQRLVISRQLLRERG